MTEPLKNLDLPPAFPDHTQLPESEGTFVKNFQEQEKQRADRAEEKAFKMAERLRALGLDPDNLD